MPSRPNNRTPGPRGKPAQKNKGGRPPKKRAKRVDDEDYRLPGKADVGFRPEGTKRARPNKKYVDVDTDEGESDWSTSSSEEEEPMWVLDRILAVREVRAPLAQVEARKAADAAALDRVEKGLPPLEPEQDEKKEEMPVVVSQKTEEAPAVHKKKRGKLVVEAEQMTTYKEFYVKLQGASFRHTVWLSEEELLILFNPYQTKNMIKRFLAHQDKIQAENEEKYMGEHFDQRFLEVDRIIDSCEVEVPTSHLGNVKTGKPMEDKEYEGKMVPYTRVGDRKSVV